MMRSRIQPFSGPRISSNKGYVLATSLLLLVVMAMLGVSMYGNVTVQEKMADNMRVKSRTLVAVKSAVQSNWTFNVLQAVMVSPGDTSTNTIEVSNEYDDDNVELSGVVKVCYLGETQCPGFSLGDDSGFVCKAFFTAGHVIESSTGTSTTIEQAGFMLMQHSDDLPNCNEGQMIASGMAGGVSNSVAMITPRITMPTP